MNTAISCRKIQRKPLPQRLTRRYTKRQLLPASLLLLSLAGCAPVQTTQDTVPTPTSARVKAERGDHTAASRDYLDLALASKGIQRQRYLIFAAGELFIANDIESSKRVLDGVGTDVAPQNLDIWAEVTALIKLSEGDPQGALNALNKVTQTDSPAVAIRIQRLRAEALFKLGRTEAAVATLIEREKFLERPQDIANNHRLIWSGLQSGDASLTADTARTGDPVLQGWLELGYIAQSRRGGASSLSKGLEEWQLKHPDHPANGDLLGEILASLESLSSYPNHVAVLLPLSGKQQGIGEAIRDGYLAAHYALGSDNARPTLLFYDTAANGAASAYQQAGLAGAEFVIGPLLKSEIAAVAAVAGEAPITTLVLNYAPDDLELPPGFYQFALAPEDEARGVAIRVTDEGMRNAVALIPDTEWGNRVLQAFEQELTERGGTLLTARTYPSDTPDFSPAIREILLLDESYARRQRLAANLGKTIGFEPRRRQDVDFIFVAANAATAKLIQPQLSFHYAGEIPTYATSSIYLPGTDNNTDINGMVFPDMPWLLEPTPSVSADQTVLTRYWGAGAQRRARFYAMGYDAYYLSALLNGRTNTGALAMNGTTGKISMDESGRLHRELRWARMERGQPRTLPEVIPSLSQEAEVIISLQ